VNFKFPIMTYQEVALFRLKICK